jgi:hypothetical protein
MTEYVIPALGRGDASEGPGLADVLTRKLAEVNADQRMPGNPEPRMVPSVEPKERPRPFDPKVQ